MIQILIAVLISAIAYYVCLALGLPQVIGIVAALLVLLGSVGYGRTRL